MSNLFIGAISVKAVIEGGQRKVNCLYFNKEKLTDDRNLRYIDNIAKKRNLIIKYLTKMQIDEMHNESIGVNVIAEVENIEGVEFEKLKDFQYLALIYGMEDPYNLGYSIRSLYASGCQGILLNSRNWESVQDVICRSSAGASELMPIYFIDDVDVLATNLKNNDFQLICAERSDAVSLYDYEIESKVVIGFGGEKRGLPSLIKNISNQNIYIPYANDFRNALNASAAISVIAFEFMRKRGF